MTAGELRSQLAAQQRSIGTRDTDDPSAIQQRAHESLPLGDFLHFVQEDRRTLRGDLMDQRQNSWKVSHGKLEEPGVFEVAVKGLGALAHQLRLQSALAAAAHPG